MNDWLWEHVLIPFVMSVPGWLVATVAVVIYPGLGLAVPLVLGWPANWMFSINVVCAMTAGFLAIGYLLLLLQETSRRHLIEWTTDLRLLTAAEFEYLVGELFRREGWKVAETGRQDGPDGNVDLRLNRGRERRIVQCKRWTSWRVGVNEIRAFTGTLALEGAPGKDGIFVTLSQFTEQAEGEAKLSGMTLIDGAELFSRIERVRRVEPCPLCDEPMLFDRSSRGWWFRCVARGCTGKRDLGADAGRAIELLTQPSILSPTEQRAVNE